MTGDEYFKGEMKCVCGYRSGMSWESIEGTLC
jgi:hypothetical protein